jgi:glycosyltransferase involved in cell wall biosynthesis
VKNLRVAIVNWRDPWHPQAGGAEVYAWQMARRLAQRGARVRYITARARGQARRERREGIEIVRAGGRFTVYPRVLAYLAARRGKIDVALDCQNGIPFFTPVVLPSATPVILVMHHVHTAQFGVHFPRWMARIGQLLEGPVARRVYRGRTAAAVSQSTVTAMRERLDWPGEITIIPNGTEVGLDTGPLRDGEEKNLTWVGRLVAHKRPELLREVAERFPDLDIDVIGQGPAAARLDGAPPNLRLRGYLPAAEKQVRVARSVLHLNTSQGEGWGLCVLEAAALGVPTVAFDVDGLRDSIRDGETGWLVRDGERFADVVDRALKELGDPRRREQVATACRAWAARFDWDTSAAAMAELIERELAAKWLC